MTSTETKGGNIWGDELPQFDVETRLGWSHKKLPVITGDLTSTLIICLFYFISIDPLPLILPTTLKQLLLCCLHSVIQCSFMKHCQMPSKHTYFVQSILIASCNALVKVHVHPCRSILLLNRYTQITLLHRNI
jgi:hypothetical protein